MKEIQKPQINDEPVVLQPGAIRTFSKLTLPNPRKQIKGGRIVTQTLKSVVNTTVQKKNQVFQPHSGYPAQT